MPLGQQLFIAFQGYVAAQPHHSEEDLFNCLISAITHIPGYSAKSIHGNKRRVVYTENRNWFTKRPARCELADVAIIAFSQRNQRARLILIQNKLSKRNHPNRINADLVQYELLRDRPFFEFTANPYQGVPNGLIHWSPFPSVCQYGIFYHNGAAIDMSVITADHLVMRRNHCSNSKSPKRMLYFDEQFQNLVTYNPRNDFIAAENIRDFGDFLEQLYIGRPITNRGKLVISNMLFQLYNHDPYLYQQICDFLETDLLDQEENMDVPGEGYADDFHNIIDVCRQLVLINVDLQGDDHI